MPGADVGDIACSSMQQLLNAQMAAMQKHVKQEKAFLEKAAVRNETLWPNHNH